MNAANIEMFSANQLENDQSHIYLTGFMPIKYLLLFRNSLL